MDPASSERRQRRWTGERARGVLLFALGGVVGGGLFSLGVPGERELSSESSVPTGNALGDGTEQADPSRTPPPDADLTGRGALSWLAVGGGADPSSTQVQLEQDLALFTELAGASRAPGAVLFAGGPGVRAVQVLDPAAALEVDGQQRLRAELGALLDPRPERDARFRLPSMKVDAAADAPAVLALLRGQLALPGERLDVFVAAHGDMGETPAENFVSLWGDSSFDVRELSAALTTPPARRAARFVITTCFGGGFAELAFADAEVSAGPAPHGACGLFATSAEHESNGCDPNPDRQAQQGYALHVLNALRGRGRDGQPVTGLDLDGDGRVGLLEAHTRARVASDSIDLPSTTSERFLRSLALEETTTAGAPLPAGATREEDAVVAALGARLSLHDEASVALALASAEAELAALALRVDACVAAEDEVLQRMGFAVAARWPELLDPFRADFDATLRASADAVAAVLDSPDAREHERLRRETDAVLLEEDQQRLRWVLLSRLARAFETARLARALLARAPSDPSRLHYEALLACERAPLGG